MCFTFLPEGVALATQNKTYSKGHLFDGNFNDCKNSKNKPT